jgi:hypothetical protein
MENSMRDKGILVVGKEDMSPYSRAKSKGLELAQTDQASIYFDKTLIVAYGTRVPWDLLPAAWHFLDKWDAAVPLWRYGITAKDVGDDKERKLTKEVIGDLRVPLHSCELLFVRRSELGTELIETWLQEIKEGGDKRLAFLRALHLVKPFLCVLPASWLADVREYDRQATRRTHAARGTGVPLVSVEIAPGQFVKCHQGDEDKVIAHFSRQRAGRN